jgi:hypothetical protein
MGKSWSESLTCAGAMSESSSGTSVGSSIFDSRRTTSSAPTKNTMFFGSVVLNPNQAKLQCPMSSRRS